MYHHAQISRRNASCVFVGIITLDDQQLSQVEEKLIVYVQIYYYLMKGKNILFIWMCLYIYIYIYKYIYIYIYKTLKPFD